jgi:hypothetical protein
VNDLSLKPVPKVDDAKTLFSLDPSVLDIGDQDQGKPDGFEGTHYCYRFFRECDGVPFIATSDRFQSLNAWYLSDASFLAYATSRLESSRIDAIKDAELIVAAKIKPALQRLFRAAAARDQTPADPKVKVFVRSSPLVAASDNLVDPVQCYVADNGDFGIVAFRGTLPTSLTNWLTDFEVKMVMLGSGDADAGPVPATVGAAGVHEGFYRATLALLRDVIEDGMDPAPGLRAYLKARWTEKPNLRFWFTGHSLGAAMAAIAAYEIGNVQALYTFGSPRVGDVKFAELFSAADIAHYRFVHHDDIVPHVPIHVPLLFGYEHVGDLKYIEYDDEASAQTNEPRTLGAKLYDSMLESQLAGQFENVGRWMFDAFGRLKLGFLAKKIDLLTDHAPLYYSNILWNGFVKERARLLGQPDPSAPAT